MNFNFSSLITGLKSNKFHKIVVLTGAGISVSAGIPDFRSPTHGIYNFVSKYGDLPYPEAIFDINYFTKNPIPFYKFCLDLLKKEYKPTMSHYFIAGLRTNKLIQCHGNIQSSKCISCLSYFSAETFFSQLELLKPIICTKCKSGLIKPNIIFFGENLPLEFNNNFDLMKETDLVIVIGTPLKIYPFADLQNYINYNIPILYINKTIGRFRKENSLTLQGDADNIIKNILFEWDAK